jgi:hypothetical protein
MKKQTSAFLVRIGIDISAEMAMKNTKIFDFGMFPNPMRLFGEAEQGKQA